MWAHMNLLAGWTPPALSGLTFWVRADMGITIATGVSAWADQSGTGDTNKNQAQGTGSKQPTRNASDAAYNNQPTLSFASASSQMMSSAAWSASLSQPYTICIVGNDDGTATTQFFTDNQAGAGVEVAIGNNDSVNQFYSLYGGLWLNSTVAPSSAKKALIGVVNGVSSSLYVSAKTASVSGNAGPNALTGVSIGSSIAGAFPLNGKVAEVAIYSRALSTTEVAQVLTYFGSRYAITIGA